MISILIGLKTDKEDLKKMQIAFKELDSNNDGILDLEEFKSGSSTLKSLNFNGNGTAYLVRLISMETVELTSKSSTLLRQITRKFLQRRI